MAIAYMWNQPATTTPNEMLNAMLATIGASTADGVDEFVTGKVTWRPERMDEIMGEACKYMPDLPEDIWHW